jgi:hypothetical protein
MKYGSQILRDYLSELAQKDIIEMWRDEKKALRIQLTSNGMQHYKTIIYGEDYITEK